MIFRFCIILEVMETQLLHFTVSVQVLVFMMGAPADHLGHVLRLLVDGGGPQQGSLRGLLAHQQLQRGGLGQLAEQLVETLRKLRVTPERRGTSRTRVIKSESASEPRVRRARHKRLIHLPSVWGRGEGRRREEGRGVGRTQSREYGEKEAGGLYGKNPSGP